MYFGKKRTKEESDQSPVKKVETESSLDSFLDKSSLDVVYPFSWEEFPDYIESGDNFIRVIAIVDYPKVQYGNWLSELKRKKGNITISQFLQSSSSTKMIHHYNETIKNKEAELLKIYDPLKRKRLEQQIETANRQLDKYLQSNSSFIYQYTYIYLNASTLEALNDLTENITKTLIKLQMKSMVPVKGMYQAFWSALPIGENLLGDYTYKESNTEVASSMFPFDDAEILHLSPRSDVEGINKDTNSLIAIDYLDRKNTLNQNMVVIGTSGVGKTTYMIQKILRYVARDIKVFIIDPENEYSQIVEHLGGTVVHLSSNAQTKINPLEIFSEEISENIETLTIDLELLVKDKIQRVKGFFQVLKPDITQVEQAVLDSVLRNTYLNAGIFKYSSISEIKSEQYPTLENVFNEIEKLKQTDQDRFKVLKDFYYILESYVHGSTTLFNGHTNININANLLSFDLKALQNEADVQAAAYLNTFSFLWDEITKNKTENIKLVVDEFHFLTQNSEAAQFFYQAYKRFRKYNAGAIAGTQQIQDVLEGTMSDSKNVGEAIIGNSYTKVFFGLDDKGVEDLTDKLHMNFSEKEKKLLSRRKQGEALIIHGSQRAFMKVELTEEELRLKDPERYEEHYGEPAMEVPNYEERIQMTPSELVEAKNFLYD
ncbi:VirB4 family type IV secretion system protein [Carnobacterium inhibens]|uniref:Conjugal transfer protein n=2 Tax=Carnobacterium inhibens TaxID=147709 RepID=U5SCA7_9LACT|nr:DUF87 domain-containing protein [Carnobacterium inhibens]AGY82934.1 conjugal transfer protein [Carnobacterium inhibens subsp. gilichinskyi]MBC9826260.1 DUF87 domain-containing protein [Carnobacterium inhibens]